MSGYIIKIDENKCSGCGLCVSACKESAIGIIDGKAKLLREDYCDGLGNCLQACPSNAITFETKEANNQPETLACGCPGTNSKPINRVDACEASSECSTASKTHLNQWPIQIKLVPPNAPYFKDANLLVAADCTAYAYGNFHSEFMKNHITVIGCPKLDDCDYTEKLTSIMQMNNIKSITVVRMEVPCCSGIESAVKAAVQSSKISIQCHVVTITTDGIIL
ncbi:MAG: 4Fe-4S binding protein [Defluviitaleaceae bacterium]|nr:4Fe-4S binding protein [Defluviitaleaceae bacterium]